MTLIPARYGFSVWTNTTFRKTITLLTGGQGSPARDLTGYTASMAITDEDTHTLHYTLSTAGSSIVLGGVAGTIMLYLSAATISTFTWTTPAVYELVITDTGGSGDSDALIQGPFRILLPT